MNTIQKIESPTTTIAHNRQKTIEQLSDSVQMSIGDQQIGMALAALMHPGRQVFSQAKSNQSMSAASRKWLR
jgi:hypothetical protein